MSDDKHVELKRDINQQGLKNTDLHFVKYE